MCVGREETIEHLDGNVSCLKTILHFAAAGKSDGSTIVEHIIAQLSVSLVNQKNFKGQTPLHVAITHANETAAEQLLAAGSFREGFRSALEETLLLGADPSLTNQDGNTALHLSTSLINRFHPSNLLSAMVSHQSDLLCQTNQSGFIPLHIALKNFDYQTISFLLPEKEGHLTDSARRSLFVLDPSGRHSLHYAAQSGLTTFILRYFKDASKDILNQQDALGLTPLHYAW